MFYHGAVILFSLQLKNTLKCAVPTPLSIVLEADVETCILESAQTNKKDFQEDFMGVSFLRERIQTFDFTVGKAQLLQITLTLALLYSSVPV